MNSRAMLNLATTALILGAASSAYAQFTIDSTANVLLGTQPSGAAVGDFDNDGDVDVATTVDGPDRIAIALNDGAGNFVAGPSILLGASSSPQDVEAGDLDGDGDMDLAAAMRDPSGSVVIRWNMGGGVFAVGPTIAVGDRPRGLSIADFDGDGDMDIAAANRDDDTVSIITNNGNGTFSSVTLASGAEPRDTAFGDFDADGDLDLAVTNHDARTVSIFTNTGGAFALTSTLFTSPLVRPEGIGAADLDGDGDADLAVITSDQTFGINQASIYLSTPGEMTGPFEYPTGGTQASQVAIADLDCDGDLDLAVSNEDSNNLSLLANQGGAIFAAPQLVAAGANPSEVAAGDFDGDGDSDVTTANRNSNDMTIVMNGTCLPGVPGDVDGDGLVGFDDLIAVLSFWGPCPGCAADLDGNGDVGFTDLTAVLSNWS